MEDEIMALRKEITLNNGVVLSYHKIGSIRVSQTEEKNYELFIFVDSYVNQDKREESLNYAVESNGYDVIVAKPDVESTPIFTIAYEALKTLPIFDGAVDV
jgi:hypothetical protein